MSIAGDIAARIARGEISATEATQAHLDHIAARDGEIEAWAHLDPEHALAQAAALDKYRSSGRDIGPLHGVSVGLKDIFDTVDMQTENGLAADAGRRPRKDSAVAQRLRQAGAVILGKTVTTEAAYFSPGKTKNPHDPTRTPGGSSSGSAAAVAAGMVPLAIGSQTNGSMIRPASFCDVVGFKPTFGKIARTGALMLSRSLDHVGVFATSVDDAALLADCLFGPDGNDPDVAPMSVYKLRATATEAPPVTPALAFVKGPTWERADSDVVEGFGELTETLGDLIDEVALPAPFDGVVDLHQVVMSVEMSRNLARYDGVNAPISDKLREQLATGKQTLAFDYLAAREWQVTLRDGLNEIFQRYDAILTPAATGQAPQDLTQTGDPAFCTLWTFCGVPAVSLPLLSGVDGMPIGVQLVGRPHFDGRLLRVANWLVKVLSETDED